MAVRRGPHGRFEKPDAPPPADDAPLFNLNIEPVDDGPAFEVSELPTEPELELDATDASAGDDAALAVVLAHGIDELVGLLAGASYRAESESVDAVGEAAAPVLRRVLSVVHASELAESTVPAPVRELVTLGVRVYVAWGDGIVVLATRQLAAIRESRNAQKGSAGAANGGTGSAGGNNGPDDDRAAEIPLATDPAARADPLNAGRFSELRAIDTYSRRSRPGAG